MLKNTAGKNPKKSAKSNNQQELFRVNLFFVKIKLQNKNKNKDNTTANS